MPNKRVYVQRLQQEVAVHRTRMSRLDQLENIYSRQGMRARVAEVAKLRNREVNRFQRLLQRFRDALGPEDFGNAAAALRLRGRETDTNGASRGAADRQTGRSAPERQPSR